MTHANNSRDLTHNIDPDDLDNNNSGNPSMHDVLAARLHRRHVLKGGVGAMAMAGLGTLGLTACATGPAVADSTVLGFKAVNKAVSDRITVPEGYTA
ncbi:MAG: phosphatase, partial [Pseudomonadota bacterium]